MGGTIFNNSPVGASIPDVILAPNTHVIGGVLKGQIMGDSDESAILEALTIKRGAMLENVIIARNVKYAQGIDFCTVVQFVNQGFGIVRSQRIIYNGEEPIRFSVGVQN